MSDWPLVRLGDHLVVKHGFAFQGEYFSDRGVYIVLTPGNFVETGGFKPKSGTEKYFTATPQEEFVLRQGDLVIAMTEQAQGLLGSSALIPADGVYLHNQRIGLVEATSDEVDRLFLYYLFNTRVVRDQIQATATGSKVRHTAPARVESVTVPLPPLPIQRKISAILSAYDDLIDNNDRRIKLLEEMAQRIYRHWFVEFRYPGRENVPLVDSELGPIPEGWEIRAFSELGRYVNGFAFGPAHWGSEGLPIIKIRELKDGVRPDTPRYSGDLPAKYAIHDGDLLFSWSADLDAYLWTGGSAWLNQHLFRVDPLAGMPTAYLFHSLKERMEQFRSRSQGTTMRHIKRSALSQVMSIVPPERLRDRFPELVAPIDLSGLELVRSTRTLRATRDLLLPRLISGEIDVTDRDIDMPDLAA